MDWYYWILTIYSLVCYGVFFGILYEKATWNDLDFSLVVSYLFAPISLPTTLVIYYIIK